MSVVDDGFFGRGEQWLATALEGGLPEPTRERWQPLRVGIVGLWEYDNAEFWYADGRLVLRGGNGTGKTKVLELTTLMLFRGEIQPSVLDPFGSQHRTMRFNLLPTGEGDDPRPPADSGLGYAWAEFGRLDERGHARFFVCGMGMSARRGTGTANVATWHFVTSLRPRKEVQLIVGGRALEQKQLRQIDGVAMPGSAGAYRDRLARDLFGLSSASYDNLTELLKQLRKPKLGERLSPKMLEDTLRDALPPLDTNEVAQLADGWDRLEQLRGAVEQTQHAALAVAQFVRDGWRPWARATVRERADVFTQATTALDNTTRARNEAQKTLQAAQSAVTAAQEQLATTQQLEGDRNTEFLELLESASYQEAVTASSRVEHLRGVVKSLGSQVAGAERRSTEAQGAFRKADQWLEKASANADTSQRRVADAEAEVRDHASPAGLAWSVDIHLPQHDLAALRADHQMRQERFTRLCTLFQAHAGFERSAEISGELLNTAEQAVTQARHAQTLATQEVEQHAETFRQQIREWSTSATAAKCSAGQTEDWCDQISDLTIFDTDADGTSPADSVVEMMRKHVTDVRRTITERVHLVRATRSPVAELRDAAREELELARSRTDTPPPAPTLWSRRERPDLDIELGAPLWRLVNPIAGLDEETLGRLEAAAAASGLLDAWVSADGVVDTVDGRLLVDVQLTSPTQVCDQSLLEVLEPDENGCVDTEVVRGVLAAIGLHDSAVPDVNGDWLAADGSWRLGGLTGRAEPVGPASYLGAAARAAARQRDITRLETELTDLNTKLAELDEQLDELAHMEQKLAREELTIPANTERELLKRVSRLAERVHFTADARLKLGQVRGRHEEDLSRRDQAWAAFAEYATEHDFPLRELEHQRAAISAYSTRLDKLAGELELLGERLTAAEEAQRRYDEQDTIQRDATAEVAALHEKHRQAKVRLETAEKSLNVEHAEQLRRKDELQGEVERLRRRIEDINTELTAASADEARASAQLEGHESQRTTAEEHRDATLNKLWELVDHGFAEQLGLALPDRRAVQAVREFATGIRRDIVLREQEADVFRSWRRCTREVENLRQRLLPDRDVRVEDDEADAPTRITVLVDPERGWLAPTSAANALTDRVREQQERFNSEQQRVLTTLLGSAFIEHLKDRLDYTAQTFQRISDQLAARPTRQGHVVRVTWEADSRDPDAGAVVNALRQGYHQLTTDRQEMVRDFLRRRIEKARDDADAEGTADWKDQLTAALDYRLWLRLGLQYRQGANGTWALFDAAKHGAKSGGEKVVLLAQPLFAAAVVAYNAADPHAPRCVWLDEAMTGVDATVKASFMGLTVDFELDVMLTAHDEWCTYTTVPAVAIYDLARQSHIAGVDIQPYLWCGRELKRVEVQDLGSDSQSATVTDSLFRTGHSQ